MRKFVKKIAIIVCLSVAAVPAVLFGYLWLWIWYHTARVESFYQGHRLLREMRAVQKQSTSDSGPAREALLRILPLGTDREIAVAVLRREGFGCHITTGVDCQVETQSVMGYDHWIVDLEFDPDGHLSDARVMLLYIFL